MWPIFLDFAVPIAIHSIAEFMKNDSNEDEDLDTEALIEYLDELEDRVIIIERKIRALQIAFIISVIGIATIGYFLFLY